MVYLRNPKGDGRAGYYVGMTGLTPAERLVRIQLTRANRTKTLQSKVVRGPSNRWYVGDTAYEAVQSDFCRS